MFIFADETELAEGQLRSEISAGRGIDSGGTALSSKSQK